MLQSVNVRNLALIKEADIELKEGLNVLSGETGAGKSIIIGSILLALGGKVSKDMIRGEQDAFVELVFHITDSRTLEKLKEMEIDADEGMVIISRKITKSRNIIKVNGESFTASNLKKITELLIDIHGQHDHQSLLKVSSHLSLLDEYGRQSIFPILCETNDTYREYRKLLIELEEYNMDEEARKRELSFCEFEISEIEDAGLKENEYLEVEELYRKIYSSKKLLEVLNNAYMLVSSDGSHSAGELISRASGFIQGVADTDEKLAGIASSFLDLESICQDICISMKDYINELNFDEETIREVEERSDLLNKLRMKYASQSSSEHVIRDILAYRDIQAKKLERLRNYEEQKEELLRRMEEVKEKYKLVAGKLSDERKKCAKELENQITDVLKGLNFLDVKFTIGFTKLDGFTEHGLDGIEFLISTNPGEPVRPLSKIASGGELSRIMLGLKTIMASKDHIETLIFDEIDTGISGRTAQMVAERMKEVSRVHQVICISHLPQIAAMADSHYLIEKTVENGETHTNITSLDDEASVMELARMLGGAQITNAVIDNARELKKHNK